MFVKIGDKVKVIAGSEKGKEGTGGEKSSEICGKEEERKRRSSVECTNGETDCDDCQGNIKSWK